MKKRNLFLVLLLLCTSFNLFAELKISTQELKNGLHYVIDSSVNIRKEASLKSEKIGKVNLGEKIEVLEKTNVYFESEGIYDCFYKVKTSFGTGYMFGGYISDNADVLIFQGKEQNYFDKLYNYEIKIPQNISYKDYNKLSEEKKKVLGQFYQDDFNDYFSYTEFVDETPSFERLIEMEKILKNSGEESVEKKYSKLTLFTQNKSSIEKTDIVYNTISEVSLLKNQFTNASFIKIKFIDLAGGSYLDATELYTFQNGKFINKRRCANYAQDEIYQTINTFIFPAEKGGEKDTIKINEKYLTGNTVTEEYETKIIWNGKDFIEK